MPIPHSARRSLARRLDARRQERWPDLLGLSIRYRSSFACLDGTTAEYDSLALLPRLPQ